MICTLNYLRQLIHLILLQESVIFCQDMRERHMIIGILFNDTAILNKKQIYNDAIQTQKENVGINSDLILLVRENNRISAKELAETLGISFRQCERIIAELKEQDIIERKGSKKSGHWEIKE